MGAPPSSRSTTRKKKKVKKKTETHKQTKRDGSSGFRSTGPKQHTRSERERGFVVKWRGLFFPFSFRTAHEYPIEACLTNHSFFLFKKRGGGEWRRRSTCPRTHTHTHHTHGLKPWGAPIPCGARIHVKRLLNSNGEDKEYVYMLILIETDRCRLF